MEVWVLSALPHWLVYPLWCTHPLWRPLLEAKVRRWRFVSRGDPCRSVLKEVHAGARWGLNQRGRDQKTMSSKWENAFLCIFFERFSLSTCWLLLTPGSPDKFISLSGILEGVEGTRGWDWGGGNEVEAPALLSPCCAFLLIPWSSPHPLFSDAWC